MVAVAQHRLKSRLAEDAAQRHISEARKAIKASLMDADADNQLHIEKYHAEQQLLAAEEAPKPAASATAAAAATAAAPAAAPSTKKQFTWAELNAGDDAEEEQAKVSKKDTHNLMKGLLAAPKVDADEAETGGATMVTTEFSDEETKEQESPKATIAKITDAADSAAEQEEQEEAPPAQEVEIKAEAAPAVEKAPQASPAQKEEEVETEVKEAPKKVPKKAAKAAPKVEKKAVAQKVAAKVAKTAKKVEAAAKPAPKQATKEAADKVKAAPVPESQEVEEEEPIVADGYKEDDEYENYDKDDDW